MLLRPSGSGALALTPRARWATGQYSNKLGGQGVLRPTLRASHSSLLILLPLLVSPVCQGRREAGAASFLVCVVGMACVSFLVFGLIAGLSPESVSPGAHVLHFVPLPPRAGSLVLAVGREGVCWPQGEGPMGRACLDGWRDRKSVV